MRGRTKVELVRAPLKRSVLRLVGLLQYDWNLVNKRFWLPRICYLALSVAVLVLTLKRVGGECDECSSIALLVMAGVMSLLAFPSGALAFIAWFLIGLIVTWSHELVFGPRLLHSWSLWLIVISLWVTQFTVGYIQWFWLLPRCLKQRNTFTALLPS